METFVSPSAPGLSGSKARQFSSNMGASSGAFYQIALPARTKDTDWLFLRFSLLLDSTFRELSFLRQEQKIACQSKMKSAEALSLRACRCSTSQIHKSLPSQSLGRGFIPFPSLPRGLGPQHCGGLGSTRDPFFQYYEPLGASRPSRFTIFPIFFAISAIF